MDIGNVSSIYYNNQDHTARIHSDTLPESILLDKVMLLTLKNIDVQNSTIGVITEMTFKTPVYIDIQKGFFGQHRLIIRGKPN